MCACPRAMPRKAQTSSASASFAEPQKILNLSSTRGRCGLLGFSSAFTCVFFSVVVARVAMFLALTYQVDLKSDNRNRETGLLPSSDKQQTLYLAGPLGFEPRQSAPKALDL